MLAAVVTALSAPGQRAAATALAVEPPAAASLGQTATPETRKQIARWIYEDKIEQQQSGSKLASRASSSADILVKEQDPPYRGRLNQPPRAELENDPHYRHIPNWAVSGHKMPDNGSFPAVMIAGQGKCGTNVLAEALYRLNFNYPLTDYSIDAEEARQGWAGEVNWAAVGGCAAYESEASLAEYRQIFSPADGFGYQWLDKSTSNLPCAKEIAKALPQETKFFSMMCDPVMAMWSRMNQIRQALGEKGSNPQELDYVLQKRLHSAFDCYTLISGGDKRLEQQQELCYQLEGGLQLFDIIGQWKENVGGRMQFLLAEESKQNASYLVVEAARHLGVPLPDNPNIGDVHSNTAEETYLEPEVSPNPIHPNPNPNLSPQPQPSTPALNPNPIQGPLWDYFVNRMRPTFRPLIKQIAETYPAEFPDIMAHWSAVTAWESGGR